MPKLEQEKSRNSSLLNGCSYQICIEGLLSAQYQGPFLYTLPQYQLQATVTMRGLAFQYWDSNAGCCYVTVLLLILWYTISATFPTLQVQIKLLSHLSADVVNLLFHENRKTSKILKRPRGRAVSAPDFGSRGRGFESRWRRDSSRP